MTSTSDNIPAERHPFEPFLPKNARILFLGSFPPQPHRWCMPFYYPNWINDFWRIMGLIHFGDKNHFCVLTGKRFDEDAIRAFSTDAGLAFYDTACEVRRLKDNASDAFLEVVTPTDIPALLARIPLCNSLVATGQKATEVIAATFGCEIPPVGGYIDITLPEPPDQVGDAAASVMSDTTVMPAAATVMHVGGDAATVMHDGAGTAAIPNTAPAIPATTVMPYAATVMPGTDQASRHIRFWRMPSTSRAYPLPLEKKAEAYRRLF